MLIKFFRNGKGAGAGPVGYLVADKVLAYDDNRDLIRDADGQPMTVTREPLPEVSARQSRPHRGPDRRQPPQVDLPRGRDQLCRRGRPERGTAGRGHGRFRASGLRGAGP